MRQFSRGRLSMAGLGLLVALVLGCAPAALAASPSITEFSLPSAGAQPTGIAAGRDGALWFTEAVGNKIGRITTSGHISEFSLPTASADPIAITAGRDGALWFTEFNADKIGRITTSGQISEFAVPTAGSKPFYITAGPDGNLWFTEAFSNQIARITPAGVVTEFPMPYDTAGPSHIVAGPDGNLWFTVNGNAHGGALDSVTPAGQFGEYAPVSPNTQGVGIASADGALWYGEVRADHSGAIGHTTTSGASSEFALPATPDNQPQGLAAAPDGSLWFTVPGGGSASGSQIGRITTAGTISEYATPTPASQPEEITAGPDGAMWFTETAADKIGRIGSPLTSSPPRLIISRQRLRAVLRTALKAKVGCLRVPCTVSLQVVIDAPSARRLGLGRRSVLAGRVTVRLSGDALRTVRLRLSPSVRRRLRRVRRLALTIRATDTPSGGSVSPATVRHIRLS